MMGLFKKKEPTGPRQLTVNNRAANTVPFVSNFISTGKYSALTFVFANLFEQFHRAANCYFLLIAALQQIKGVSPTGRWTTVGPLSIVLLATMIKEGVEDWKRHRSDDFTNNQPATVMINKVWTTVKWSQVQVGDVVKVTNRQVFPADLVMLSSSEPMGICYIETAALDGETNLKIKQSLEETSKELPEDNAVANFAATIECENPNKSLYTYEGSITYGGKTHPLGPTQMLLRGAMLRNTQWIVGVAVFTGHESKLMMNAARAPSKMTSVERIINSQILSIFAFLILLCTGCAISSGLWFAAHRQHSYLALVGEPAQVGARDFLTFFILFNNLIPISLYVSMEVVKLAQAFLVNSDALMYYAVNNTPALARTSNLNEELGQIEYIFSDKTGTLTCNIMEFKKCTIGGVRYGDGLVGKAKKAVKLFNFEDPRFDEDLAGTSAQSQKIKDFLQLLGVCHTVIPERDKDGGSEIIYQAASPDEGALVTAAKVLGCNFHSRTPKTITVSEYGKDVVYELLNVCEFNSTRKRMSTIYRCPDGKVRLYCKGADSVIMARLKPLVDGSDDAALRAATNAHLESFAAEGLRTLCLAVVELEEAAYLAWNQTFVEAAASIGDRDKKLADCAEAIEVNMTLVGATAIEDKLQDGVPETIFTLGQAGIKIWVLTGDKQETAINIGFSCRLLNSQQHHFILNEDTPAACILTLDKYMEQAKTISMAGGTGQPLALIADGKTLEFALNPDVKVRYLALARMCKSVICCRVSPAQKAEIVLLVKNNVKDPQPPLTLSIGDGANDVPMIQMAHVGVGISGEEGLQAARAADYAIAQFRFLERLLLVHGNWSYRRISKLILYSFYKNIALYLVQLWFTINNGFSGQSIFERWAIGGFNVLFTSIPVLIVGALDQDLTERQLLDNPTLYIPGQLKKFFNLRLFWQAVLNAIWHSAISFYFTMYAFSHGVVRSNGQISADLTVSGAAIYTVVVIVVNVKLGLDTSYWTMLNVLATAVMVCNWFIYLLVYCRLQSMSSEFFSIDTQLLSSPIFWFTIILVPTLALLRDYVWLYVKRTFFPDSYQIVQEQRLLGISKIPNTNKFLGALSAVDTLVKPKSETFTGFGYDAAPPNDPARVASYGAVGLNESSQSLLSEGSGVGSGAAV